MAIKFVKAVGAIHERSANNIVSMDESSNKKLIIRSEELEGCLFKGDEAAMKAIREEDNEGQFTHLVLFYKEMPD